MRADADEDDKAWLSRVIDTVDEEKIAANVAFAVLGPLPLEGMIEPFGTKRGIIGDEKDHRFLETVHVVPARSRETFPVL